MREENGAEAISEDNAAKKKKSAKSRKAMSEGSVDPRVKHTNNNLATLRNGVYYKNLKCCESKKISPLE